MPRTNPETVFFWSRILKKSRILPLFLSFLIILTNMCACQEPVPRAYTHCWVWHCLDTAQSSTSSENTGPFFGLTLQNLQSKIDMCLTNNLANILRITCVHEILRNIDLLNYYDFSCFTVLSHLFWMQIQGSPLQIQHTFFTEDFFTVHLPSDTAEFPGLFCSASWPPTRILWLLNGRRRTLKPMNGCARSCLITPPRNSEKWLMTNPSSKKNGQITMRYRRNHVPCAVSWIVDIEGEKMAKTIAAASRAARGGP